MDSILLSCTITYTIWSLSGLYDTKILDFYTKEEIHKLDEKINHDRDYIFEYAGVRQLCDKYLIQDRDAGQIYETPQFVYMLISMVLFANYPKAARTAYVTRAYGYFSKHKINLPTPIMCGIRTPERSGASCCLMEMADDLKSIGSTNYAAMLATASKYGIGVDMSNIRCVGGSCKKGRNNSHRSCSIP